MYQFLIFFEIIVADDFPVNSEQQQQQQQQEFRILIQLIFQFSLNPAMGLKL